MRAYKSELNVFSSKDRDAILSAIAGIKLDPDTLKLSDKAEILKAIEDAKPEPVVVDNKVPQEILDQQQVMMKKIEEMVSKKDYPSYRFNVHRNSQGFIKSVDAIPTNTHNKDDRKIEKDWYE